MSEPSPARRLRRLMAEAPLVAPGTHDAITARAIEAAGFAAVFVSGSGLSLVRGKPDIGWMTESEVAAAVGEIADCVGVPVIADADTGYGNVFAVRRTVRDFERAGAAGLELEDQVTPKRCAYFSGLELVSKQEMVGKVKAALDARHDPDFVIIARTDALSVSGLPEALERGAAYLEAGADLFYANALHDPISIQEVLRQLPNQRLAFNFNHASGPAVKDDIYEPGRLGYRLTIVPGAVREAVLFTVRQMLSDLRQLGTYSGWRERMVPFQEFNDFMGLGQFEALERRFSPAPSET